MSSTQSSPTTAVEAVPQLVQILTNLAEDERQKAISAAMILMGSSPPAAPLRGVLPPAPYVASPTGEIGGKAASWMAKVSLTQEQLEHVFSIESDGIEVIAAKLPGKSKRQQTLQAYLLAGLRTFLRTGESAFADDEARELCKKVGCYDSANHHNYVKALGNSVHGSKATGWKLTNPGLAEAAKVVKDLVPSAND